VPRGPVVSLKELCAQRGLTQAALGVLSGVSQPEISLIAAGKAQAKPESVVKLARALRIDARRMQAILENSAKVGAGAP
jgi:transcriptional regulator with XRE-family HTH domain